MKLKKLLKHIGSLQKVQILIYDIDNIGIISQEIIYEGLAHNVPWHCAKMHLDTDFHGEAIDSFIKNNESIITIYVQEKK